MLCEQVHEHLSAYLDKELTAELSAAVRSHLDSCAECRALLAELRATADLLGRLPVHAAPEQMAQDVQREIERRALVGGAPPAEEQPRERTLPVHRARLWPRALAVAATVALAAGIGILAYLTQNQQAPLAPEVTSPVLLPESQPLAEARDRERRDRGEPTYFRSASEKKPAKPEDQLALQPKHGEMDTGKLIVNPADQVALVPTPAAPTVDNLKGVGLPENLNGAVRGKPAEPAELKSEAQQDVKLRRKDDSVVRGRAAEPTATRGGTELSQGLKFEAPPAPPPPAPEKAERGKRGLAEYGAMDQAKPKGTGYGDGPVSGTATKSGEAGGKDIKQKGGALAWGTEFAPDEAVSGQTKAPAAKAPPAVGKAAGRPAPGAAPAAAPAIQTQPAAEEVAPAKRYAKTEETIEGKSAGDKPTAERRPVDTFGRPRPETRAEPERPAAPPAPPPMSVAAAPAAKPSPGLRSALMEKAAGAGIALVGPAAVQQAMVSVVDGRAALEDLKAVATRDNLSRAEYQLVLVADSRREGSQALQQMFQSNGWQAVSAGKTDAGLGAMKRMAEDRGAAAGGQAGGGTGAARAGGGAGAAKPLPSGLYYAASNGAEDTWVVLTDRDSLSRFGSRLLLAQDLSVAPDSSVEFRPLAKEQTGQRLMIEAKDNRAIAAGLNAEQAKEGEARENRAPAAAQLDEKLQEADLPDYKLAKVGPRPPQEAGAQAEAAGERGRTRRAGTAPSGAAAGAAAPSVGTDQLPPVRLTTPGKPAATAAPSSGKAPPAPARYFGGAADKGGTAAGTDSVYGFLGDNAHRLGQTDDKVLVVIHVRQADAAGKASKETKPAGTK
jgi:anti-sigma factor RsiW